MAKELLTLADRIKSLRERAGLTQAQVARLLGLTRSGVNAWEMGLSVPSTQYVVELAKQFDVSTTTPGMDRPQPFRSRGSRKSRSPCFLR